MKNEIQESATILKVARRFAERIAENIEPDDLDEIDERNRREADKSICHSHDFCDANVHMQMAIMAVTGGLDAGARLTEPEQSKVHRLWQSAWDKAKSLGFRRLSHVRGDPDDPAEMPTVTPVNNLCSRILLPGLTPVEEHPLEVCLDYWGSNPHLQVLCYGHDSAEGAPQACVRYDSRGKVVEIVVGSPDILVVGAERLQLRNPQDTSDTPWEVARDSYPACLPGDKLRMPSGQLATVMRLHDRYDGEFSEFKHYAETYGLLERLNACPGHETYATLQEAWNANPLTAGTSHAEDFAFVPERQETVEASVPLDPYTRDVAYDAACVWEWALEEKEKAGSALRVLFDRWGTCEMREALVQSVPHVRVSFERAKAAGYENCFDWEFVPWFMENCVDMRSPKWVYDLQKLPPECTPSGSAVSLDRFAIFCDTTSQPTIIGTTEDAAGRRWLTFETEREAQLDIVEDLEEHIRQFKEGERGYDEVPLNFFVLPVTLHADGSISTEFHGDFPRPE